MPKHAVSDQGGARRGGRRASFLPMSMSRTPSTYLDWILAGSASLGSLRRV